MKKDERLIEKALLKLKESGESEVDFPDRKDKNKEIANQYYTAPQSKTLTLRKKAFAAGLICVMMFLVIGIVSNLLPSKNYDLEVSPYYLYSVEELHAELDSEFTVFDELGDFKLSDKSTVYKTKKGQVVYSELSYIHIVNNELLLEMTMISVNKYIAQIVDQALFESLFEDGEINGHKFTYESSSLDGRYFANIEMGSEKCIWIVVDTSNVEDLFKIIDEITAA